MTSPEPVPDTKPSTIVTTVFHRFDGGVVIGLPCIITDNNTLFKNDEYSLIDFGDNGNFIERQVKFFDSYLGGYVVTIVLLDLKTGELIKRWHRLKNDDLPCDWVLTDYFNSKTRNQDLMEFCFSSEPEMQDSITSIPDADISCHRDSFYLDREFILTQNKNLIKGMPYMYTEGNHTKAVRLTDIQVCDGILYLKAEELQTLKTFRFSWNLDYKGSYYLWSIADLPTMMSKT